MVTLLLCAYLTSWEYVPRHTSEALHGNYTILSLFLFRIPSTTRALFIFTFFQGALQSKEKNYLNLLTAEDTISTWRLVRQRFHLPYSAKSVSYAAAVHKIWAELSWNHSRALNIHCYVPAKILPHYITLYAGGRQADNGNKPGDSKTAKIT